MKVVVYVLCYDDESESVARKAFTDRAWAKPLRLRGDTRYMEGEAFLTHLHARREEWADADFVGTVSYKAPQKIAVPDLDRVCSECMASDVIALVPSIESMVHQALTCHPRFLDVWVPLLRALGHDPCKAVSSAIPFFACNYWLAKPEWMTAFLDFYRKAVEVLDTLPEVQDAVWSDAGYDTAIPKERLRSMFDGREFITYHPFVCERLACYYAWASDAVCAMVPCGRQAFWLDFYQTRLADVQRRAKAHTDLVGFITTVQTGE
jgi:hypothetical protein